MYASVDAYGEANGLVGDPTTRAAHLRGVLRRYCHQPASGAFSLVGELLYDHAKAPLAHTAIQPALPCAAPGGHGLEIQLLDLGGGERGAWDARSFSVAVIVPWVAANNDVIGTSAEPYASKPLRRPAFERDAPNIRNKGEWAAMYDFFAPLDDATNEELVAAFRRCLSSVARRMAGQSFRYQIPVRVSLPVMLNTLDTFLREPSGGFRALAVTTAMMGVLGEGFSLFARIESQGLNEADVASGAPGDIMCYDQDDDMALPVEVKDRNLTLSDVRSSTRKAREADAALTNLLFSTLGVSKQDAAAIDESAAAAWASGLNVYQANIIDLAASTFALLAEAWRPALLRQIGDELDRRGDHAHRRTWHALLSALGERTS